MRIQILILGFKGLKRLCHGCLVHFVYNASHASLFAMEVEKFLVNGKIIKKNQIKTKSAIQVVYQTLQTIKMNFENLLG